ncbi:MAG: exodeoxyribonuclease V subunit gamma [Clostridiales bacterium]|nr:exodeoxyribonuclease V subunit gamma [Candidatus Crickella caballi]
MIRIYTARENINKERFIYEHIEGETLVIVPNQYTLVAEEQALKYLDSECLFNIEIITMNRLGLRILTEQGLESTRMLDKYGRFMLLNRIIKANRDRLDVFAGAAGRISFIDMLNDFISDFKQQNCSMDEIRDMLSGETDELLGAKLSELELIIDEYEKAIEGKYTDSEDYIAMYVGEIAHSSAVKGKNIWVYGYDSITPKFMKAMFELSRRADSLNFIVNRTDFELDEDLLRNIYAKAAEEDVEIIEAAIGNEYALSKSDTITRIERGLWSNDLSEEERSSNAGFVPEDLTMVCAANPYYEAETAAAYIWHLVRDLGYRMQDIQIIANNEDRLQPIIRRTLVEYGLPVYLDGARSITDAASVSFVVNMLSFLKYKEGTTFLLSMLKSGLTDIDHDEVEQLENYVRKYKIKGSMWRRPFKYGAEEYGEEKFAELEQLRQRVMSPMLKLEELTSSETVADFITAYREYLNSEWELERKVEEAAKKQADKGLVDEALKDASSYSKAMELLEQVAEIMGDEALDIAEFIDIYTAGLMAVDVGVIPAAADGLSLGTMIRTRPRPVRAVVVLGANEGILPLQPSTEGLFSVDEKKYFKDVGFAIGRLDDIKMEEENAAMYRVMSKASDKLYISYAMADADGAEANPSQIIDALYELFPMIKEKGLVARDAISAGWGEQLVNSSQQTMRHFINHLKDRNGPERMDDLSAALMNWYELNEPEKLGEMLAAAQDENAPAPIGGALAKELYSRRDGNIVLSASSIDNYFRCPFKYFVDKGLRPQEEREFSSDPRSIGDVYHECLMSVARRILADRSYGLKIVELDDEALEKLVSDELDRIAKDYEGGLFISSGNEEYRLGRIKEICAHAVRALAEQLASESVVAANFEENFGRGKKFKPLEFEIDGTKVYVEGKIDRADILGEEVGSDRVRIIDYKTGNDSLDTWKMKHGYKMQLMIYMMSAEADYQPAGMFYFNIKDDMLSFDDKDEFNQKKGGVPYSEIRPEDQFKLAGVYVDEAGVLDSMPETVLASTKHKLSIEEYRELRDAVSDNIRGIAEGIVKGNIDIHPFREGKKLVCNYCRYKAICKRDGENLKNQGWELPPKPKKDKEQENKQQQ